MANINGDVLIAISESGGNINLTSLRDDLQASSNVTNIQMDTNDILSEPYIIASGATLTFRDSTAVQAVFSGDFTGAGNLRLESFTSNNSGFRLLGDINIEGTLTYDNASSNLHIGGNVGSSTNNVTINVTDNSSSEAYPLNFYKADLTGTNPVLHATITGGVNTKFISYIYGSGFNAGGHGVTLASDFRNNSNYKVYFGQSVELEYSDMRSLINTGLSGTNTISDYLDFDIAQINYTGNAGYTHPARFGIQIPNNSESLWNNRSTSTNINEATGGDYSNPIHILARIAGPGTNGSNSGNLDFGGFTGKQLLTQGYRQFKIEEIQMSNTATGFGDVTIIQGATVFIENASVTERVIDCNSLFVGGDLIGTGRIEANTQIQGGGRLLPGARQFESMTIGGNLQFHDNSLMSITIGNNADVDDLNVTGNLEFPSGATDSVGVQLIPTAGTLETRTGVNFLTFDGTAENFTTANFASKLNVLPYHGTVGELKTVIDADNSDYPAENNNTFTERYDEPNKALTFDIS